MEKFDLIMKKWICLLFLVLCIFVSGCGVSNHVLQNTDSQSSFVKNTENPQSALPKNTEVPVPSDPLPQNTKNPNVTRDLSWYDKPANGGGAYGGILDGSDNYGLFADAKATVFEKLPVYIDDFPMGFVGPNYEATEKQIQYISDMHESFMGYYLPGRQIEALRTNRET